MGNGTRKSILMRLWEKYVTRELVTYGIAGILTTLVNFVIYDLFCNNLGIENLVANVIAWIFAVTFAYVINYIWVFHERKEKLKDECEKIFKFYSARLVSLGVEELGLFIFVDIMKANNMVVKAVLAVFVIIINYIFSKLYIFNKKRTNTDSESTENREG